MANKMTGCCRLGILANVILWSLLCVLAWPNFLEWINQ